MLLQRSLAGCNNNRSNANLISGFLHLQTDNQLAKHCNNCTGLNSSLQLASVHVNNGIRRSVVKIIVLSVSFPGVEHSHSDLTSNYVSEH